MKKLIYILLFLGCLCKAQNTLLLLGSGTVKSLTQVIPDANVLFATAFENNGNDFKSVNNGTATNVTYTPSIVSQGAVFTASNSSVMSYTRLAALGSNAFTFGFWVKTTASTGVILGNNNNTNTGTNIKTFAAGLSGGTPTFSLWQGNGTLIGTLTTTTVVNDNLWHYIMVTRAIGSTFTYYVDNVQKATLSSTSLLGTGTGSNFAVGTFGAYTTAGYTDCFVDEITLLNITVSLTQRNYLYNSGNGKTPPYN